MGARLSFGWVRGRPDGAGDVSNETPCDSPMLGPALSHASSHVGKMSGVDVGLRRRTPSELVPQVDDGGAQSWDLPQSPRRTAGTLGEECSNWNFARGPLRRATCTTPLGANLVCHRGDASGYFETQAGCFGSPETPLGSFETPVRTLRRQGRGRRYREQRGPFGVPGT